MCARENLHYEKRAPICAASFRCIRAGGGADKGAHGGAWDHNGNVYAADIDDLRTRLDELWEAADGLLRGFANIP